MKKPEKQITVDNPLVFSNEKTELLHEAFSRFSEVMDEYLQQHPESKEEIASLKAALKKKYTEQKLAYLLEDRLSYMSEYLHKAFSYALDKEELPSVASADDTQLFYLRSSKRFTLNH